MISDPVIQDDDQNVFESSKGTVRIVTRCTPDRLRKLSFEERFGVYAKYRSIFTRRETLEEIAAGAGANVTVAVVGDRSIVGFGVLDRPGPDERWYDGDHGIMAEVKALEVCRNMRSAGIARTVLGRLLATSDAEGRIVYLVGYSWTWDLEGTGMTVMGYRRKLITLYEAFGFKEYQTNDFNICLKPENIFMARVGEMVSAKAREAFKWRCFGQNPE